MKLPKFLTGTFLNANLSEIRTPPSLDLFNLNMVKTYILDYHKVYKED